MLHRIPLSVRFIGIIILLAVTFIAALSFGSVHYPLRSILDSLLNGEHSKQTTTLLELRLPRNIAAILIGGAFGVAGTIMQALTRNPLADPGLLGVSAGAKLGLSIVIAFLPSLHFSGIMIASFLGALLSALLVLLISQSGNFYKVILAGAALSAFLTAIATATQLITKTSKNVTMWTSGGLVGVSMEEIKWVAPILIIFLLICMLCAKQVGILTMSEEVAVGLGLNTVKWRLILLLFVAVLTGVSVSLIGEIAFIGLIIPHFARFVASTNYQTVLPMSALTGAIFLLASDTMARSLMPPFEIPVIAILSIVGLPFFVSIVKGGTK